jgi:hypothetical protein
VDPDDAVGDDDLEPSPGFSKGLAVLANHEGAIRILRWGAAAAFLIWLLNAILTASILWEATAEAQTGTGWIGVGLGPVDTEGLSTAERLRAVIVGTIESSGFWPLVAVLAYGLAALLSSRPASDTDRG